MNAQAARRNQVLLGLRHLRRLAFDELHAAGRAPRVAAAGVELVDPCFLAEGVDPSLALRHVDSPDIFTGTFRHKDSLYRLPSFSAMPIWRLKSCDLPGARVK